MTLASMSLALLHRILEKIEVDFYGSAIQTILTAPKEKTPQ